MLEEMLKLLLESDREIIPKDKDDAIRKIEDLLSELSLGGGRGRGRGRGKGKGPVEDPPEDEDDDDREKEEEEEKDEEDEEEDEDEEQDSKGKKSKENEGDKEGDEEQKSKDKKSKGNEKDRRKEREFKYPQIDPNTLPASIRVDPNISGAGLPRSGTDPGRRFKPSDLLKPIPLEVYRKHAQIDRAALKNPALEEFIKAYFEKLFRQIQTIDFDPSKPSRRHSPGKAQVLDKPVRTYVFGVPVLAEEFHLEHLHWMMDVSGSMDYRIVPTVIRIYRDTLKRFSRNKPPTGTVIYHSGFIAGVVGPLTSNDMARLASATSNLREKGISSDGSNGSEVLLLSRWHDVVRILRNAKRMYAPVIWITDLHWNLPTRFSRQLSRNPILLLIPESGNRPNLQILLDKLQIVALVYDESSGRPLHYAVGKYVPGEIAAGVVEAARKLKIGALKVESENRS